MSLERKQHEKKDFNYQLFNDSENSVSSQKVSKVQKELQECIDLVKNRIRKKKYSKLVTRFSLVFILLTAFTHYTYSRLSYQARNREFEEYTPFYNPHSKEWVNNTCGSLGYHTFFGKCRDVSLGKLMNDDATPCGDKYNQACTGPGMSAHYELDIIVLGMIIPLALLVNELTGMSSRCAAHHECCHLTDRDLVALKHVAEKYHISLADTDNDTQILDKFETALNILQENKASRMTFMMASNQKNKGKPINSLFSDTDLGEPQLCETIFYLAGMTNINKTLPATMRNNRESNPDQWAIEVHENKHEQNHAHTTELHLLTHSRK